MSIAVAPDSVLRVLDDVLDVAADLPVREALVVESLAYSMLLAGPAFDRWRRGTPRREVPPAAKPVLVSRTGQVVQVVLNVPERRNAFGHAVRDALIEALELVRVDLTLTAELTGNGPAFCSGGDLDEFGTTRDVVLAHSIRLERSAGLAVHVVGDRVRPLLHGACVGAGIEVPAFASHVRARRDAWFCLPERSMGLIPGAGGTVSITRRIGRDRLTELWSTSGRLDAETALRWGLVDELV